MEISIPRDVASFYGHFFPSRAGDFVITDAVANERGKAQRKGNLISRLNLDWASGRMDVVPLCESDAHEAGRLLAKTRTTDVVDAVVVTVALRNKAIILTGDPEDIERLVRASGHEAVIVSV